VNREIHGRANEIMNFVHYLVTAINEEFQDQIMNISSLIDKLEIRENGTDETENCTRTNEQMNNEQ
jgi:hypothetical protein